MGHAPFLLVMSMPVCSIALMTSISLRILGLTIVTKIQTDSIIVQDCEPSNYAKVNKKPRCPVPGCKEKLNIVNTHTCKHCNASVCLKHRFAEDHACQQKGRNGTPYIIRRELRDKVR